MSALASTGSSYGWLSYEVDPFGDPKPWERWYWQAWGPNGSLTGYSLTKEEASSAGQAAMADLQHRGDASAH